MLYIIKTYRTSWCACNSTRSWSALRTLSNKKSHVMMFISWLCVKIKSPYKGSVFNCSSFSSNVFTERHLVYREAKIRMKLQLSPTSLFLQGTIIFRVFLGNMRLRLYIFWSIVIWVLPLIRLFLVDRVSLEHPKGTEICIEMKWRKTENTRIHLCYKWKHHVITLDDCAIRSDELSG